MLEVQDLSKRFLDHRRTVEVFSGLNFSVESGEVFGLVGPSGSGKTTLLRVLGGLEEQTSGTVGRPDAVGMAFQQPLLFPWLTVLENVELAGQFRRHRGLDASGARRLLEEFGLRAVVDADPASLSGGQAQRASFARALHAKPEALLLDEPFAALDPAARIALQQWLKGWLRHHQLATVLVTHDVEEALFLCTKVALLLPESQGFAGIWDVPDLARNQVAGHRLHTEILNHYQTDVVPHGAVDLTERFIA